MKLLILATLLSVTAAGRLDNAYLPPNQGGGGSSGGYNQGGGGSGGGYNQGGGGSGGGYNQGGGGGYNAGGFGASGAGAYQGGGNGFGQNGGGFGHGGGGGGGQGGGFSGQYNQGSTRAQASADANAQITRYNADNKGDSFSYDFETSNGIRADAHGVATNGVQEQGSFGYKGDDGQDYSITYTADENGYRPQGAHLPTPPPIPQEILEALQKNAQDEANGIVDDGQYHGDGAQGPSNGYGAPSGQYNQPSGQYNQPSGQYNQPSGQYNQPSGQYNQPSGNGGAAPSRNYLGPAVEAAKNNGNGNFNARSGYRY